MKIQRDFIGLAGEYLVLSRLTALGLLASLGPRNKSTIDIFVTSEQGNTTWMIQVKSRLYGPKENEWMVSEENSKNADPNLIYCFVDLQNKPEKVYVIPSIKVVQVLSEAHTAQMKKPMKDGSKRTKHQGRKLKNKFIVDIKSAPHGWMEKYCEKWDVFVK